MGSHKEIYIDKEIQIGVINNSLTNGTFQAMHFRTLHLLLELHSKNSPCSKELVLQITDESNPLVLLSAVITEGGYFNLKSTQGLLVDFNSFPHHLLELIRKCIKEQEKDSPKFALVLRTTSNDLPSSPDVAVGRVSFEVIELNAFKHLCHLSLNLTPASLQTKLEHLSSCVKLLKTSLDSEKENHVQEKQFLTQNVEELRRSLSAKEKDMIALKEETRRRINSEVDKCNHLVRNEKELNLKWRSDFDRRVAREKRDLESKFNERFNEVHSKNTDLLKRNADLGAKNKDINESLRKADSDLRECHEELKRQTKHLNSLVQERAEWERESLVKQDKIKKLEMQIVQQNLSLEEQENILQINSVQLKAMSDQKHVLEAKLEESLRKLEKREKSIQQLFPDFQKSLHVIKQFMSRLKEEEAVNSSLSKSLKEKEEELKKLKETHEENSKKRTDAETEVETLNSKLKEAVEKIKAQENTLKNNENVISWLNKQLSSLESLGAVMKRAPLTEAYIHPQGKIESFLPSGGPPLVRTTSTPSSNNCVTPPNFRGDSVQSKIYAPNTEATLNDIPKVPKEISSNAPENKENSLLGLDQKYLEPTNPLPVHGLLRANAVSGQKPTLKKRGQAPIKGQKGNPPKQSAYFAKKS